MIKKNQSPPKWADRILEWFCDAEYLDEIQGDLHESFYQRINSKGAWNARAYFILDVMKSFNSYNIRFKKKSKLYSQNLMIGNYLKIATRIMGKNSFYSGLNIMGLALGIACSLLIIIFIIQERSYDSFHRDSERIFRITEKFEEDGELIENSASLPWSVGPTLWTNYPDVKVTRMYQTWQKIPLMSDLEDDAHFYEDKVFFVDSSFFEIFSFPLIIGDPKTVLKDPQTLVITEKMAQKYFPGEDPIGKVIQFENSLDFTVRGVAKDVPVNSHFHFEFLAPLLNIGEIFKASGNRWHWEGWYWNPVHTYVKLPKRLEAQQFDAELAEFVIKNFPPNLAPGIELKLQPLRDIHLKSNLYQELESNSSERSILVALSIAGFILLIAAINFINLTTARSFQRAKEVALRKVMGSARGQLIFQFFGESVITAFIALVIAVALAFFILAPFETILGVKLDIENVITPKVILLMVSGTFVLGILSGFYPALLISRYKPLGIFRMSISRTDKSASVIFRKSLVIFQFTISIILLISAAIIYQQHNFLINKELGFNSEEVIMIPIQGTNVLVQREAFKNELARIPQVISSCAISDIVGEDAPNRPYGIRGAEQNLNLPGLFTDHDFVKTFQIKLLEGRDFNKESPSDAQTFLINKEMIGLLPEHEWAGESIQFGQVWRPVIGVIDDFHFMDLKHEVRPLLVSFSDSFLGYLAVRVKPGNYQEIISGLEKVWKNFESIRPFTPFFLNERLNNLYEDEKTTGDMIGYFSLLAIFIACMGLLGLATYSTQVRVKEIGIRKVLGASSGNLIGLISRDFSLLVFIAMLLSWPVAWYLMNEWLSTFTYRVNMSLGIFVISGIGTLLLALMVISINAFKAATANPVDSLRNE